jgi:hypothetical protein
MNKDYTHKIQIQEQILTLSQSTIDKYPESALSVMFSGRHSVDKVDEAVVVERDPKFFATMIFYLENLKEIPKFREEIDNARFK